MELDFIIDVVCPWCFVGKRQLDKALAGMDTPPATINYRPYQLNPDTPPAGVDRKEAYQKKFGNENPQLKAMREHLLMIGPDLGIQFDFESTCRIANSMDAHRLIRWAKTPGVQGLVADDIMSRYFEHCEFIGDHDLLLDVAKKAGMDSALVAELLGSDTDKDLISNEVMGAHRMGVQGVPVYILDQKTGVSGAQEAPVLRSFFEQYQKSA